jgi:disulfide bond formation protein DsbB
MLVSLAVKVTQVLRRMSREVKIFSRVQAALLVVVNFIILIFSMLMRYLRLLFEPKNLLLAIAVYCAGLLLFAMWLVHVVNLVPCPLCIAQRFFYAFVGLSALAGYMGWWQRFTIHTSGLVVALFAFSGWMIAARHVYLQRFQVVEHSSGCAVSFGSILDDFLAALGGTGNCALVDWTMLGLSIADWSFIAFTGLTIAGIWIYKKSGTSAVGAEAN